MPKPPPPYDKIPTATPFDEWITTHKFFDAGERDTQTIVIDGPGADVNRYAYGKNNRGFWFYIVMTREQESQFWLKFREYDANNAKYTNTFTAFGLRKPPPTCGTPTTDPCPPDPPIAGAMEILAGKIAGPGASKEQLAEADRKVLDLVLDQLEAVTKLYETDADPDE